MRWYSLLLVAASCHAEPFWAGRRIPVPCEKVRPAAERYLVSRGLTFQKATADGELVYYGKHFRDGNGRRMPNSLVALDRYAQGLLRPKAQGAAWVSYAHVDLTGELQLTAESAGCLAKLHHRHGFHGMLWYGILPVDGDWSGSDTNGILEAEYLAGIAKEVGTPQNKSSAAKPAVRIEASGNNHESQWAPAELQRRIAKARTVTLPDASHPEAFRAVLSSSIVRSADPKHDGQMTSFQLRLWPTDSK